VSIKMDENVSINWTREEGRGLDVLWIRRDK
jgi:hypothetical protein